MTRAAAIICPRALRAGSTIGVCSPAGPSDDETLRAGVAGLEARGYRVRRASRAAERAGYLAGSDAARRGDFLELVRAPDVDGIVFARGGYGIGRWLREIDPDEVVAARKPIVGYSDTTLLSLWLHRRGFATIHGPMLERGDGTAAADARLDALLRGDAAALEPLCGEPVRGARARGPLVGGSLTMLASSLGTPYAIDARGAILFFEDVNEAPYAIDRKLVQLRDAGVLASAVGAAVGSLVGCESERYPEPTATDVIRDILTRELDGPIVVGLPFGHVADNRALAVGVSAEIDGERGTLALLESAVEEIA